MSTYVYMVVLESSPERYDRGIRWLSGGVIGEVYASIADAVLAGGELGERPRVLDIGCGTGGLSRALHERGAEVLGIDKNPGMLEVAKQKLGPEVELLELGALEIEDRFAPASFQAITACLLFSELTPEEQDYVLRIARSRLVRGGRLAIADEVAPRSTARRWLWRLSRLPAAAYAWLLTQTTSRPVAGLAERVRAAGFDDVSERSLPGNFVLVQATRKGE